MASSSARLHAGARSFSRAPALSKQAEYSSMETLRATKLSMPSRQAVANRYKKVLAQAKVKRKSEAVKGDASDLGASRMPWAAVAAATALVSLGASHDSAYADSRTHAATLVAPVEAPTSEAHSHILGSSLSAPLLVSEDSDSRDSGESLPLGFNQKDEILLTYQAAEPLQHAFNEDDFRAKLPNGAGPLGGGEWSFSATRTTNRSCPAWGSNPNIEMVVPGAAKALQPRPPRGSKRWFASFEGVDTSQLQGGVDESDTLMAGAGGWEYLEVAETTEEGGSEKGGEAAPAGKNPFEGLIIEIVRRPVFSCFSL